MNYTFKNSSIASVNSGTIVLNVSGKIRTFIDAKLVSAVDGNIVLDLPYTPPVNGAYRTIHLPKDIQRIFISNTSSTSWGGYYVTQYSGGIILAGTWSIEGICRNATPEEIQELNDQLAAEGKRWNPDTMQIEKLRWKPQYGDDYYRIAFDLGKWVILNPWWSDISIDRNSWQESNCFKTREEAEAKLKEIKKILNSTI